MPLVRGNPNATMGKNTKESLLASHPHNVAIASAMRNTFKNHAPHFAAGGPDLSEMSPWWTRKEASGEQYHSSGLFHGESPGRTDTLNREVPPGGYVIPADVVSGMGEGNTMAGAAVLDRMFHSMPYGIKEDRMGHGSGPPHPPASYRPPSAGLAKGGNTGKDPVSIVAASGEYLVHPDDIVRKFGSLKRGHGIIDKFITTKRKQISDTMKKLPGPKK